MGAVGDALGAPEVERDAVGGDDDRGDVGLAGPTPQRFGGEIDGDAAVGDRVGVFAVEQGVDVDQYGHVDTTRRLRAATLCQCVEGECLEVVQFQLWVGGAGVGLGVVEQRFEGVAEPGGEQGTGFGVELAAQVPHPGFAVGPGAQAGVASLLLQSVDAVVGVDAADLGPDGAGELVTW